MEQKCALLCAEEITTLKNQVMLKRQYGSNTHIDDSTTEKPRSKSSAADPPTPEETNDNDTIPPTPIIFLQQHYSDETK